MRKVLQLVPTNSNGLGQQRVAERRRLLLKSSFRFQGDDEVHPITIHDISSTGMKANTSCLPFVGGKIEVDLRDIGRVPATVIWAANGKMGVRFDQVIDPNQAQITITGTYSNEALPLFTKQRSV